MRSRLLVSAAALALAATLGTASAHAASAGGSCVPSGATITGSAGALTVFTPAGSTDIRACRGTQAKSTLLGTTQGCASPDLCQSDRVVAFNSSCVALQSYETDRYDNDTWTLVVYDVRHSRGWTYALKITPPAGTTPTPPPGSTAIGPVTAAVLGPGCAAAWINTVTPGGPAQVRSADAHGRLLRAAATNIDPTSLMRSGGTITWTQGGVPVSATLSGAPRWRQR